MKEFIPVVLSQLIGIINRPKTPKTLLENTGEDESRVHFQQCFFLSDRKSDVQGDQRTKSFYTMKIEKKNLDSLTFGKNTAFLKSLFPHAFDIYQCYCNAVYISTFPI